MTPPNGKESSPAILNRVAGILDQVATPDRNGQVHPLLAILRGMASILDLLTRASSILSAMALAVILLLTLNEVSMRYFFNSPTTWANDVNQWFFALTVLLVIPEITRTQGNIAITVLLDRLPHTRRDLASRAIFLLSFSICIAAVYISGIETLRQYQSGITTMWVSPIPKWWISTVIPFGFLLTALQFLRLFILPGAEKEE